MKKHRTKRRVLSCIILLGSLMAIPAYADAFLGLPSTPDTVGSVTWSNFTSSSPLPTDLITQLTVSPNPTGNRNIVTFAGTFALGVTYTIDYTVSVAGGSPSSHLIIEAYQAFNNPGSTTPVLTTALSNGVTLTNAVPDQTFPGVTTFDVVTTITAGDATTAFGNTYTETAGTPEPGTLALVGTGILGIAGVIRRKRSA